KTPDALISGEAVSQVISSCIPSITDPWQMPATDVDFALIAIRIASFGEEMELEYTCTNTECAEEFRVGINLNQYIEQLGNINISYESTIISYGELKIHIKPLSYFDLSIIQRRSFEEQRAMEAASQMEELSEEERQQAYQKILNNLTELNISSITSGVQGIELPDGELVTNKEEIIDFVNNTSVKLYRKITDAITTIRETTDLEPVESECPECKNVMQVPLLFDYANFFV
ncbi:uncharacterized protein METZ01_LOCUS475468, partial [marine metagenome]